MDIVSRLERQAVDVWNWPPMSAQEGLPIVDSNPDTDFPVAANNLNCMIIPPSLQGSDLMCLIMPPSARSSDLMCMIATPD